MSPPDGTHAACMGVNDIVGGSEFTVPTVFETYQTLVDLTDAAFLTFWSDLRTGNIPPGETAEMSIYIDADLIWSRALDISDSALIEQEVKNIPLPHSYTGSHVLKYVLSIAP